jgi:hypothetical protein
MAQVVGKFGAKNQTNALDSLLNENDTSENEIITKLVDFGVNGVQVYYKAPNMVLHPRFMSVGLLLI